jgi:hypothetical protein
MDDQENKDDRIKAALREAHDAIQPQDSWEALRDRIDKRLYEKGSSPASTLRLSHNAVFWRRVALAAAACLVVTVTLLIYTIKNTGINRREQMAFAEQGLLNQNQLEQLNTAFSHVRELFGEQCPWMVIDSGGEGEIGVNGGTEEATDTSKVIVIRLAVNFEGQKLKKQYFDIVTYPNQQVSFSMAVNEDSDLGVSVKPFMASGGGIAVEIKTGPESGDRAGETVTVASDKFTSLTRVKSDGSWVDIDVVGRVVSNI